MSTSPSALVPAFHEYLVQLFPVEDDLTRALKAEAATRDIPQIWISEEQAVTLQWLVQALRAKNVLEIGCLVGYSALMMARALPPGGRVITLELEQQYADIARNYWHQAGVSHKIEIVVGDATRTLPQACSDYAPFDFVFVDADKENYSKYLEFVMTCTTPEAVIAFDNAFAFGRINEINSDDDEVRAIQEFNRYISQDKRFRATLLPVGDGLLLLTKN